jgi:hypothetical protein
VSRYEQHLDEFGAALAAAARRRPGGRAPRTRTRITLALAVAALALVVVLAGLGPSGNGPSDTVGRALAAVTTPEVIHYRVLRASGSGEGEGIDIRVRRPVCPATTPYEVWQTVRPLRLRMVMPEPDDPSPEHCGPLVDRLGNAVSGPTEVSYADGTLTTFYPDNGRADVISGYQPESNAAAPYLDMVGGLSSQEGAVAELQRMLADGRLTDVGPRTIDGRAVRTLTGVAEIGFAADGDVEVVGPPPTRRVTYDVDAQTFVPVRMVSSYRLSRVRPGSDRRLRVSHDGNLQATQLDFVTWQTLPDGERSRALLAIDLPSDVRPLSTTQDELREKSRRDGAPPVD